MAAPFIFPSHRFNPKGIKALPVPRVIDGGEALNGDRDTIETDGGGRWQITYSGIDLRNPIQERLWNAWMMKIGSGAVPCLVPTLSLQTAPRPSAGRGIMRPSELYVDDDTFPTVVRYATPYIVANLVGSVGLRETVMTILVTQGARVEAGASFGIGQRGYVIEQVLSRTGQQVTVLVKTPARQAYTPGTPVNFEWPVVRCKAVPGQDLTPDKSFGRYASMSISFVEDFSDAG